MPGWMQSFLLVVKVTGMLGRARKQSLTASSTFLANVINPDVAGVHNGYDLNMLTQRC
jgi:hypothetical protein